MLFANPGNANHWLALDLVGVETNRSAIGTRIRVTVNTPNGERIIYRTVRSGGSFGDSPFRQHIGLGNAVSIKEVEIKWQKTSKIVRLSKLTMNQTYRLSEDSNLPKLLNFKKFDFAKPVMNHDMMKH